MKVENGALLDEFCLTGRVERLVKGFIEGLRNEVLVCHPLLPEFSSYVLLEHDQQYVVV